MFSRIKITDKIEALFQKNGTYTDIGPDKLAKFQTGQETSYGWLLISPEKDSYNVMWRSGPEKRDHSLTRGPSISADFSISKRKRKMDPKGLTGAWTITAASEVRMVADFKKARQTFEKIEQFIDAAYDHHFPEDDIEPAPDLSGRDPRL